MSPRCILYISSSGDVYGAERCLLKLISGLDRSEFSPFVVLPFRGVLCSQLEEMGVRALILPLGVFHVRRELYSPMLLLRMATWIPASLRLARLISREGVEIVHSNTSAVIVGAIAAVLARVPHVWHVREIILRPKFLSQVMKWLIPKVSTRVVCISEAVRNHLYPDGKKGSVIYDGIDIDRSFANHEENLAGVKAPVVGMIGRINPYKGHKYFLHAARKVIRRFADASFVVVGGAMPQYKKLWDELLELTHELGLDSHFHFMGEVAPERVSEILASWDILVMPATGPEGLSQVILEAMAMGKPVVGTRVGGPCELIVDQETGYLVPPADSEKMGEAIERLLMDRELRNHMGERARERIGEHFTLQKHVQAVQAMYRQILSPCEVSQSEGILRVRS